MRGGRAGIVVWAGVSLLACLTPVAPAPLPALWSAPALPSDPGALRIEPATLVAALGEAVRLRVRGRERAAAECDVPRDGDALEVPARVEPGVVLVECRAGANVATTQVTFTDSATRPVPDPYAGGVVLFRLRKTPEGSWDPLGRRSLGVGSLDALLEHLGAWAFPAFPFDRSGTRDPVRLSRWIVIDLPPEVNFYQAVALLRADANVYPESYLPEEASLLRAAAAQATPLGVARPRDRGQARVPSVRQVRYDPEQAAARLPWELVAIGAHEAWPLADGRGVGIAIVDTGVDVDHVALASRVRGKPFEHSLRDEDGNGLPGEHSGMSFAGLRIAHAGGVPRLALADAAVSDWEGERGHGTAVAAVAAGAGVDGARSGVAPGAWILPVDVQENRRAGADAPLRSSPWLRALGLVYAAAEGARVATCAWPAQQPVWILHDALEYAEENCLLAVCAVEPGGPANGGFPAGWRESRLREAGGGAGPLLDVWTGKRIDDFFRRPLRGVLLAGDRDDAAARPDLVVSTQRGGRGVVSAVSQPANDGRRQRDRGTASWSGPGIAAGLVAGAAAVVSSRRPDLDPHAVTQSLLASGLTARQSTPSLSLANAVLLASERERGRCLAPGVERKVAATELPWWKRVKIKTSYEKQDIHEPVLPELPDPPAAPEDEP